MSDETKMIYIFSMVLLGGIAGAVIAQNVGVSATVEATYACEVKAFDLWCKTNAQNIIINGEQIN